MAAWTPPKGAVLVEDESVATVQEQQIPSPEGDVIKSYTPKWTPPKGAVEVKGEFKAKQEQELRKDLGLEKPEEKPGFFGSFGQMFADFVVNTLPQIMPSGKLANSPTTYEELQSRFPTYEIMTKDYFINNPEAVYSQEFSDKLNATVGKDLATVKRAFPEGGEDAFDLFKRLTMTRREEGNEKLRTEIATQKSESAERTKGIVKSYKDVNSVGDLNSYLGGLMGQAAATSSTMMVGGGVAAQILETQSAYEDGVEKAMAATGKSRAEVENSSEMKNRIQQSALVAGTVNSILEKASFGVVTAPLKKMVIAKLSGEAFKKGFVVGAGDLAKAMASESFTEAVQDANTQFASNVGAGMSAEEAIAAIDYTQIIDSAIGGAAGGGGMSAAGIATKGAVGLATPKEKPAAAAPATVTPAPTEAPAAPAGVVQGTPKISEDPLSTDKDADNNTIQTFGTGLTDKNGDAITIETITDQEGNVTHQALGGAIVGNSREEVVAQLTGQKTEEATPVAPAEQPEEVKEKPGQTKTEKTEKVTPTGKETVTKTTSEKGEKVSRKVVQGDQTQTTTVVTKKEEPAAKETKPAKPAKAAAPAKTVKKTTVVKETKPKSDAIPIGKTKTLPVQPAPGSSEKVGKEVRNAKEPTDASKQKAGKEINYDNVPKVQQRVVQQNSTTGWTVASKKNMKSPDGTKIFPIIEMKRGDETVYINTKGDSFKNISDAVSKSEGREEIKKGKKATVKKTVPPVAKKEESAPVKKESVKKEAAGVFSSYTTNELRDFVRNTKGEDRKVHKELLDAMNDEILRRSERKTKKIMDSNKATSIAKEEPTPIKKEEPAPKKEEPAPVKKEEPAPKKEEPAPKKPTAKAPVTAESQDVLDYLSGELFPETVEDFIDALSDISDYAGVTGKAKAHQRLQQMQDEGLITVKGKKITPTFEKQGNEYAPQTIEEYAPEKPETVVATNKRRSQPIGLVGGNNSLQEFDLEQIIGVKIKRKGWLRRNLTTRGFLPKPAFDIWNRTQADVRLYEARAIETIKKLIKQVKQDYGKKPTDEQIIELNLALEGKTTTPNGDPILIPIGTLRIINDMRNQVDNLTRKFVRDGVVAGDVAAKFMENLGVYLHRSYEKFDDPTWKNEVGQQTYNRAMDFLRLRYPSYSQEQLKGLIDYLLHSPDAPMSAIKSGSYGSMDLSVLKKRKGDDVLAPEIRALMGEYADPVVNFSRSIAKMAQLVSKNLFQQDVFKIGMAEQVQPGESANDWFNRQKADGKFLYREPIGEFTAKIESTGVPSPLDGLFATPEVAESLSKFIGYTSDPAWLKVVNRFVGGVNWGLTVGNPGTHIRNFLANPFFAISNGHFLSSAAPSIDTKVATEEELQATEKSRKEFLEVEARVSKLRSQGMTDLAQEVNQQAKIEGKKKRQVALDKKLAKVQASTGSDPAIKKARIAIAQRHVQANARVIKREQDILDGKFDVKLLTDAQAALKALIAKGGATPEQLDKARNKISSLTKRQQQSDKFNEINKRKDELAALEKQANDLSETAGELDPLKSLIDQSTIEKRMAKWRSYGMIDDSLAGGLMRDFVKNIKTDPFTHDGLMDAVGNLGKLNKKRKAVGQSVQGLYQMEDWVWRVRAFEIEAARYRKAYPSLSEKEIDDIAAENIKNTYPTYSRLPELIKLFKKVPGANTFISFPAEVVRTMANTIALAHKEINSGNAELKKIGLSRATGIATALVIPTALSIATRTLVGMDDDDEEALRQHLPDWSRNSTILFLNKKGQTDPYLTTLTTYIDFGAFDPYAILKRSFTALFFQNKPLDERVWDSALQTLEPILSGGVFVKKMNDVIRNQKPNGDKITLDSDPAGAKFFSKFWYLFQGFSPGIVKVGINVGKALAGETSEQGKKYDIEDELMSAVGFRTTTFDPTVSAEIYVTSQINRELIDISKRAYAIARQEFASDEERDAAFKEFVRANRRELVLAQRKYDAAVRLGADPAVMGKIKWPRAMEGYWYDQEE